MTHKDVRFEQAGTLFNLGKTIYCFQGHSVLGAGFLYSLVRIKLYFL